MIPNLQTSKTSPFTLAVPHPSAPSRDTSFAHAQPSLSGADRPQPLARLEQLPPELFTEMMRFLDNSTLWAIRRASPYLNEAAKAIPVRGITMNHREALQEALIVLAGGEGALPQAFRKRFHERGFTKIVGLVLAAAVGFTVVCLDHRCGLNASQYLEAVAAAQSLSRQVQSDH